MTRSFDCPRTGTACQNDECGAMHCMTMIEEREKPRPFRLSAMDSAAGWLLHDGGSRPSTVPDFQIVQYRQRNGTVASARAADVQWSHYAARTHHVVLDLMAYRQMIPGTPAMPLPDGWTPWVPTSTGSQSPHPIGSMGDIMCRGYDQPRGRLGAPIITPDVWMDDWRWHQLGAAIDIIGFRNIRVPAAELPAGEEGWIRCERVRGQSYVMPAVRNTLVDVLLANNSRKDRVKVQDVEWGTNSGKTVMAYRIVERAKTPEELGYTPHTPGACPVPSDYTGKVMVMTADQSEHPGTLDVWKVWPWKTDTIKWWKLADSYTPSLPHMIPVTPPALPGEWIPHDPRTITHEAHIPFGLNRNDVVNVRTVLPGGDLSEEPMVLSNRTANSVRWLYEGITGYQIVRRHTPPPEPAPAPVAEAYPGWTEWNGFGSDVGAMPTHRDTMVDVMATSGTISAARRADRWNWRWGDITPTPDCIVRWRFAQVEQAPEQVWRPTDESQPLSTSDVLHGWVAWDFSSEYGPDLPDDTMVRVRLRCGEDVVAQPVSEWRWTDEDEDGDIIAYQVVEEGAPVLSPMQVLDGWVERPVPGRTFPAELAPADEVQVLLRSGTTPYDYREARNWTWTYVGPSTIIAYRRRRPAPTPAPRMELPRVAYPWIDRDITSQVGPPNPAATVEIETRSGVTDTGRADSFTWTQDGDGPDIIRYRFV